MLDSIISVQPYQEYGLIQNKETTKMSSNNDDQGIGGFMDGIFNGAMGAMSLGTLGNPFPDDTSNNLYNDDGEQVGYIDDDGNYQKDD